VSVVSPTLHIGESKEFAVSAVELELPVDIVRLTAFICHARRKDERVGTLRSRAEWRVSRTSTHWKCSRAVHNLRKGRQFL
jgi:hypothetical protein